LIICGIDPGLDGGIAILDGDGKILRLIPMPIIKAGRKGCRGGKASLDLGAVNEAIPLTSSMVVLEDVYAIKGQGASGALNFGKGWGSIYGLVRGAGTPIMVVKPQTWKASILRGTAKDKAAAIRYALDRWPGVDLKPGRRTKHHDGLADALCLAAYGLSLTGARIIVPTPPPTTIPD
jgi:crossover junction endodeoxyribonuclease RuvC